MRRKYVQRQTPDQPSPSPTSFWGFHSHSWSCTQEGERKWPASMRLHTKQHRGVKADLRMVISIFVVTLSHHSLWWSKNLWQSTDAFQWSQSKFLLCFCNNSHWHNTQNTSCRAWHTLGSVGECFNAITQFYSAAPRFPQKWSGRLWSSVDGFTWELEKGWVEMRWTDTELFIFSGVSISYLSRKEDWREKCPGTTKKNPATEKKVACVAVSSLPTK